MHFRANSVSRDTLDLDLRYTHLTCAIMPNPSLQMAGGGGTSHFGHSHLNCFAKLKAPAPRFGAGPFGACNPSFAPLTAPGASKAE